MTNKTRVLSLYDYIKLSGIVIVGLFTAILLYPFLHELGHAVISMIFGAEIGEFSLLPLPHMSYNIAGISTFGLVCIGFGGMLFPLIVSFLIPRKPFLLAYIRTLLRGIALLSFVISLVSIIVPEVGKMNQEDDVMQLITQIGGDRTSAVLVLVLLGVVTVISITSDRPIIKVADYFRI